MRRGDSIQKKKGFLAVLVAKQLQDGYIPSKHRVPNTCYIFGRCRLIYWHRDNLQLASWILLYIPPTGRCWFLLGHNVKNPHSCSHTSPKNAYMSPPCQAPAVKGAAQGGATALRRPSTLLKRRALRDLGKPSHRIKPHMRERHRSALVTWNRLDKSNWLRYKPRRSQSAHRNPTVYKHQHTSTYINMHYTCIIHH